MSNTKAIADDYYINRLTNAKIFKKHKYKKGQANTKRDRHYKKKCLCKEADTYLRM
jgi:hypothetical protein